MARSLAHREISFEASCFTGGNVRFDYAMVESLAFYRSIVTVAGAGKYGDRAALTRNSWFSVYIRNHTTPISVTEIGLGAGKPQAIEEFLACYRQMARFTFPSRYARYADQIAKNGRFRYDGKTITADGRVHSEAGRELFNFTNADLIWEPFKVRPRRGPKIIGIGDASRRLFKLYDGSVRVEHEISLLHDEDVFLYLLKRLFGVERPR